MRKYQILAKQYPEYVSLDQLYRICKISKKSARYLVENGIIPAENTGRKTWKYKIALDDVITYLCKRDKIGSMIPLGAVSNRAQSSDRPAIHRHAYSKLIASGDKKRKVIAYFCHVCTDFEEALSTEDIMAITGLGKSTILKLLKDGYIRSIASHPHYIVPKKCLLEFLVTPRFMEVRSASEKFIQILKDVEECLS